MASLVVLIVMLALMWALVILPQQRKVKAHRAFVEQLSVGDEVVTTAGLFGTITDLSVDRVRLEIAEGVEVTMARAAIGHSQYPEAELDAAEIQAEVAADVPDGAPAPGADDDPAEPAADETRE